MDRESRKMAAWRSARAAMLLATRKRLPVDLSGAAAQVGLSEGDDSRGPSRVQENRQARLVLLRRA